jgi:sec-independent protein translocase protein TatA
MFGTDLLAPTHLLLILVVALVVLGPKRLPEVGRSLGRGLRDFRSGLQGVQEEARGMFNDGHDEPSLPPAGSAFSMVPEPITPATTEPVMAAQITSVPVGTSPASPEHTSESVTKVTPVDPDPADFAD